MNQYWALVLTTLITTIGGVVTAMFANKAHKSAKHARTSAKKAGEQAEIAIQASMRPKPSIPDKDELE
jgi:hypothetical protein